MAAPEGGVAGASMRSEAGPEGLLTITLSGRLDAAGAGPVWNPALEALQSHQPRRLVVDASGVEYCDGAGAALLLDLKRRARGAAEIRGLSPRFARLVELFRPQDFERVTGVRRERSYAAVVGEVTLRLLRDLYRQVAFVGEILHGFLWVALGPRRLRWRDTFAVFETAGVNALAIISVVGFLIGLILAFQSAIPLRQFGAELFVADLVAISLVRELGPLMTAIILAGRSGSGFAAELGTMKVNEEVDALTTMGLSPVRFLVVPRVLASVVMTPLLTLFTNLWGLAGGAVVLLSLGFPLVTYLNQVQAAIGLGDLAGGLVKSAFFGLLIAAIACYRGLQAEKGAAAVGDATQRFVVAALLLIILSDGVFAVVYYALGI